MIYHSWGLGISEKREGNVVGNSAQGEGLNICVSTIVIRYRGSHGPLLFIELYFSNYNGGKGKDINLRVGLTPSSNLDFLTVK